MGMEFIDVNREITLVKHSSGMTLITIPPLSRKERLSMTQLAKLRDYHLRKSYGITLEDYNEIFARQGEKCAICGKRQIESKRVFAVDHNHKTGKVRGILCSGCNFGFGYFEKYKEQMESYLNGQK